MAGGPLFPYSIEYPTNGKAFPHTHVGNTNSKREKGIGVIASLDADAVVELRFQLPGTLPTGTAKLITHGLANATSGNAKYNPKWKSVAAEETMDVATGSLNAEGVETVTWAAGDVDVYKEIKTILNADTLVAGEVIVMEIEFDTTLWTLAAKSLFKAWIVWE